MLLRGLTAVAFGVLAFAWPGVTLARLVLLFGLYASCTVFSPWRPLSAIRGTRCVLMAIEGILGSGPAS